MTRRRRPPVRPVHVVYALGWVGVRAVLAAGVITALLVVALHPSAAVWVPAWIALTAAWTVLDFHQTLPEWFVWFRGRPPKDNTADAN
jgi:hypothetical protein